jgi:phage tail-like protein
MAKNILGETAESYGVSTDTSAGNFNFEVEILGSLGTDDEISEVNQAFTRISGIVSNSESIEFCQGTDPYVRKAVGRTTWEEVTLERVYNGLDSFYNWRLNIEAGVIDRRLVTIRMYSVNQEGEMGRVLIRSMSLYDAWPSRWELPELDATGSGPAMERIVLTVEQVYDPLEV